MKDWDSYFLDMLNLVRTRSSDSQTQVATILTENNRIVSTGYNGFPSGLDGLPSVRPAKYKWMVHGEINAIVNCMHRPTNPTCYITGTPCHRCMIAMWNFGVRRVISLNQSFNSLTDDDFEVLFKLVDNGLEFNLARLPKLEEHGEPGCPAPYTNYLLTNIKTREEMEVWERGHTTTSN